MPALSQSSFLQALGYAIANSLWQVALLWLVTVVIHVCLKLSSHNRYRVAVTAQFAGFAWFAVTFQFYYQQCLKATENAQLLLQQHTIIYQAAVFNDRFYLLSFIAKAELLLPYLSLAYISLLCVLAVRWIKSFRYTALLKHSGLQKADLDLRMFVQNMAAQLGIRQKVKLYLSTLVTSPLTIGFLKPVILVPFANINHLTTQQLEAVLLHELAHIRRGDYFINLLLNVVETILFFNPFTRLIGQSINKEREHCCDDWVLQFKYNAPMYAEALLRIACLQASPSVAMKAEGKSEGELLWRVKRLLNQKQKRFNYSQQLVALFITTFMLVSIAWLQPSKTVKPAPPTAAKPVKAVVAAPMVAQINNPFFSLGAFFAKPLKEEVEKATQEITKKDLPKAINTGLDEADKPLTAVTPSVMNELDKINTDSTFAQATKEAQQQLKKVNWNELKKASPFIDSAFISNAVKLALDKNHIQIDVEKAKQSVAASKQQILKLKQQSLDALINQTDLNKIINDATIKLNDGELWNALIEKSNVRTLRAGAKAKKAKQREAAMQTWQRLMEARTAPRARTFQYAAPEEQDCYKHRGADEAEQPSGDAADEIIANWTYTNPVYIEKAADAANDNNNEEASSIYSFTAQPLQPPPHAPAPPPAIMQTKPLVHIVEVSNDEEHVSVIITIRQ